MASKKLVCTQCGYIGEPKGAIGGNGCIEVLLWFFFIIPGLIYSIWRSSSRYKICPKCKSPSLIPIDSPKAKTIMAESMTKEEIVNLENEQADTEYKSKYLQWLNWCKKHVFWTIIIVIVGVPFICGMISVIFSSKEVKPTQQVNTPTLTERLKKATNDTYWNNTTPGDYSSRIKLQAQSMVFSTYANDVSEGEKSSSNEDRKLALELKNKLITKQVQEYPKMRKAYFDFASQISEEKGVKVTLSGEGNTLMTFISNIFSSEESRNVVQNGMNEMVNELRFKRINYKVNDQGKPQYFDLKTPSDNVLITISL